MKRFTPIALILLPGLMATQVPAQQQQPAIAHTQLKVGDKAPSFTLPDTNRKPVSLTDFRGKKNVVLAFYVLAFTSGWTKELQAYQSGIAGGKFDPEDTQVFGISIDSPFANAKFAQEIGVTFPLLSDMTREVSKEYGILNEQKQFANRTTFVVDKQGIIQYIEEGGSAVDPVGAATICTALKKKPAWLARVRPGNQAVGESASAR